MLLLLPLAINIFQTSPAKGSRLGEIASIEIASLLAARDDVSFSARSPIIAERFRIRVRFAANAGANAGAEAKRKSVLGDTRGDLSL